MDLVEKYQYVNAAGTISEIIHNAKQKKLIPLDLQLFAAKNNPPADPPPADPEPPAPADPEPKGDEIPAWAKKLQETMESLLQSKPQSNKDKDTPPVIPVPAPPARKEEDHQEPKEKKRSFWDYLM
jgi:hypothetical protein